MEYILSQLINGLSQGFIYALMAIGFSVIMGVVGFVTFTHGEVIILGAFASFYTFVFFGKSFIIGMIAAFVASWIVGIFVYKICYEKFFNAPEHISLICTIGMSMLLKNLAQIILGSEKKPMVNIIKNKIYKIGIIEISKLQIIIIVTVIILTVILFFLFKKTRWGISLRAVSQDKNAASMMGINVKRTAMIGNSIGCALGGVAGLLIALSYQTLYATMGFTLGLKAYAAAVLGGLTSVPLAALGGICIGMVENLGITFSSATYRDLFSYGLLIIVLLIRPEGFSRKKGAKV